MPRREQQIGGSGGSLEPPGPLLEPPGPLLTRLHTVYIACSERLPTRLNPPAERACFSQRVKVTGLAQKLGQLEAVNRDLQSKYWANLKILGQPCNFYAIVVSETEAPNILVNLVYGRTAVQSDNATEP